MWRFLNSIPRAFRQQYHGPRASVGVHVEDGEQEHQTSQEICLQEKHDVKEFYEIYRITKDASSVTAESRETKRKASLVRSVLLGWNPRYEGFFNHYASHGERTKQEKEEQWWKACQHDLCALLNRNHLLEILTLGSCYGLNSESNKHTARKKLLYRVLFSLPRGDNALYVTGNKIPPPLSITLPDDKSQQEAKDCLPKAREIESAPINADNDSESIDSALNEFQDICKEYSSKNESLLGLEAAENGDMSHALQHLKKACSMGNISACFNVGLCYETGSGVSKDINKAIEYYEKAAKHGHSLAMYNLGLIYLNTFSDIDSVQQRGMLFIKEAAELGLAEAQTQMGILCMEQENVRDASDYFKAAANQSDCEAQYFLAMCYEQGLGVEVDREKSVQLYSLAASVGHEDAIYNLAHLSEPGSGGITADPISAADLYTKAVDAGHTPAQTQLQELAVETAEKNSHGEKTKVGQVNDLGLSIKRSDSGYTTLSSSASSPDLNDQYTDITSLFFPEAASDRTRQFRSVVQILKSNLKEETVGCFILEKEMMVLDRKVCSQ